MKQKQLKSSTKSSSNVARTSKNVSLTSNYEEDHRHVAIRKTVDTNCLSTDTDNDIDLILTVTTESDTNNIAYGNEVVEDNVIVNYSDSIAAPITDDTLNPNDINETENDTNDPFSPEFKRKVVAFAKRNGYPKAERMFKVSLSDIRLWKSQKLSLPRYVRPNNRTASKSPCPEPEIKYPQLENRVGEFLRTVSPHDQITNAELLDRAKEIAKRENLCDDDFEPNRIWLQHCLKRQGLSNFRAVHASKRAAYSNENASQSSFAMNLGLCSSTEVKKRFLKRHNYTAAYKIKVVNFAEKFGFRQAEKKFRISESNVRSWCEQKEILRKCDRNRRSFRGSKNGRFPAIEQELGDYVRQQWSESNSITGSDLMEKAREIAIRNNIPNTVFIASYGWLTRSMRKQGIGVYGLKRQVINGKPLKDKDLLKEMEREMKSELQHLKLQQAMAAPVCPKGRGRPKISHLKYSTLVNPFIEAMEIEPIIYTNHSDDDPNLTPDSITNTGELNSIMPVFDATVLPDSVSNGFEFVSNHEVETHSPNEEKGVMGTIVRKRGRPRKIIINAEQKPKRARGRPKKYNSKMSQASNDNSTMNYLKSVTTTPEETKPLVLFSFPPPNPSSSLSVPNDIQHGLIESDDQWEDPLIWPSSEDENSPQELDSLNSSVINAFVNIVNKAINSPNKNLKPEVPKKKSEKPMMNTSDDEPLIDKSLNGVTKINAKVSEVKPSENRFVETLGEAVKLRRRGRPKKNNILESNENQNQIPEKQAQKNGVIANIEHQNGVLENTENQNSPDSPRKRGRPRKTPTPASTTPLPKVSFAPLPNHNSTPKSSTPSLIELSPISNTTPNASTTLFRTSNELVTDNNNYEVNGNLNEFWAENQVSDSLDWLIAPGEFVGNESSQTNFYTNTSHISLVLSPTMQSEPSFSNAVTENRSIESEQSVSNINKDNHTETPVNVETIALPLGRYSHFLKNNSGKRGDKTYHIDFEKDTLRAQRLAEIEKINKIKKTGTYWGKTHIKSNPNSRTEGKNEYLEQFLNSYLSSEIMPVISPSSTVKGQSGAVDLIQLKRQLYQKRHYFLQEIYRMRSFRNYLTGQIGNLDQTQVAFYTFKEDSPENGPPIYEKQQLTVLLGCLADGHKLPPHVIIKHKTLPANFKTPKGLVLKASETGKITNDDLLEWIEKIWLKRPGPFLDSLLVIDSIKGYLTEPIRETFETIKTDCAMVPSGNTYQFQPLNVCIEPFKENLALLYTEWLDERNGTGESQHPKVSLDLMLNWIICAWKGIDSDLVLGAFKKCGISNALDGSEKQMILELDDIILEDEDAFEDSDSDVS